MEKLKLSEKPLCSHAHYAGQYVDGLRTPFIIHTTPEAHQYDDEFTVVLGDWCASVLAFFAFNPMLRWQYGGRYHDQHSVLLNQFMSTNNPAGAEPVPGGFPEAAAAVQKRSLTFLSIPQ